MFNAESSTQRGGVHGSVVLVLATVVLMLLVVESKVCSSGVAAEEVPRPKASVA